MNKIKLISIFCILFLVVINIALGYTTGNNQEVHPYITNESKFIWKLTPYEIEQQLENPLDKFALLTELGQNLFNLNNLDVIKIVSNTLGGIKL